MAWMNDEEYVFHQTNKERKVVGRSAFNKVRGGGRYVRMPSDSMTRKEKSAMNGEVVSYCLSKPMEWKVFREMPDDLKHRYVDWMRNSFPGISQALIAEAVGAKPNQFTAYTSTHGLSFGFVKGGSLKRDAFFETDAGKEYSAWLHQGKDVTEGGPVVEEVVRKEPEKKPVKEQAVVKADGADINNIAVLLKMLAGTGAKLTIEISL